MLKVDFGLKIMMKNMKKAIIILFTIFTTFHAYSQPDYDSLKKFIYTGNYKNAGAALQGILSKDDIPDIKSWIKCGDVYYDMNKHFAALYFYNLALIKFEFIAEIIDVEDLGLNEESVENLLHTRISKIYSKYGLEPKTKFFDETKETEMPDKEYYVFLAENAKFENDSIPSLLPRPYTISELNSLIESHLEEYADMVGQQEDENGDASEYDSENGDEVNNNYPDPNIIQDVDEDPYIDLVKLHKSVRYPAEAKKKKIEGVVVVNVLVDTDGKPLKCMILESDSKLLDNAAVTAIMRSRFKPAILNNSPVMCWIDIPVEFKLK